MFTIIKYIRWDHILTECEMDDEEKENPHDGKRVVVLFLYQSEKSEHARRIFYARC